MVFAGALGSGAFIAYLLAVRQGLGVDDIVGREDFCFKHVIIIICGLGGGQDIQCVFRISHLLTPRGIIGCLLFFRVGQADEDGKLV